MLRILLIVLLLLPFVNFPQVIRNFLFIAVGGGFIVASALWVVATDLKDRANRRQ